MVILTNYRFCFHLKDLLYYSSYLHYIPQSWFKISWRVLKGNAVRAWCKLACSILNSCLVTSHRLNNINLNQKSGFQREPDIPRKVSNHLDPSWDGSNSTAVKLSQERRELNGETWTNVVKNNFVPTKPFYLRCLL